MQMSLYNQTLYITSSCKFVKCIIWVKLLQLLGLTYRICSVYNRKLMNLKTSVGHKYEIFIRLIQLISEKAFRYLKTLKKAFKKFLIFLTFRMLLILAHFSKNRQDSHHSNTARDSFLNGYSFIFFLYDSYLDMISLTKLYVSIPRKYPFLQTGSVKYSSLLFSRM